MNNEPLTQCGKCREFVEFWTFKAHASRCGNERFWQMQDYMDKVRQMVMVDFLATHQWMIEPATVADEIAQRQEEKFRYLFPAS